MYVLGEWLPDIDLEDISFERIRRVHDWRNYVPSLWQERWNELTTREKHIIYIMADAAAANEEWD